MRYTHTLRLDEQVVLKMEQLRQKYETETGMTVKNSQVMERAIRDLHKKEFIEKGAD